MHIVLRDALLNTQFENQSTQQPVGGEARAPGPICALHILLSQKGVISKTRPSPPVSPIWHCAWHRVANGWSRIAILSLLQLLPLPALAPLDTVPEIAGANSKTGNKTCFRRHGGVPIILGLVRLRQEDCELKSSLDYTPSSKLR